MVSYILVNLWMHKDRYHGLKKYCDVVKESCSGKPGVEFFGIYKPLNEAWNWAYIIRVDGLSKWRQIDEEVYEKHRESRSNITQTMTRIYEARAETPKPEATEAMKYFLEEGEMWEGVDVGLEEFYDMEVKVFENKKGIWFMGQYAPYNEGWNWAHLMMFDTMQRFRSLMMMCYDAYGRPDRQFSASSRLFERYEPD